MNRHNIFSRVIKEKSLLNGSLFSAFSFINKGMNFIVLLILANVIYPEDYGFLSLYGTFVSLIAYFIALSTEGYLSVSYFKEGEEGVKNTLSGIFVVSFLMLILYSVILLLFPHQIPKILNLPLGVLFIAVFVSFFTVFVNLNLDYIRIQEKVYFYGLLSCSNAFLNCIITLLLIKVFLISWEGRVYAQLLCSLIYGVCSIIFFYEKNLFVHPKWGYIKRMIFWGIPLIPHMATSFLRQGCDRYIINYFYSVEEVGLFSFGLNLANIIFMIGLGFNQSNSVEIYKVIADSTMKCEQKIARLKKLQRFYWILYFTFWFFITILGYFIFPFFFPKYFAAMNYFVILSIYAFFFCVYLIYTNYLFYYGKTKDIMLITFFSSICHLALSLLFTRYSLYLTAVVYVIIQMFVSLMIMNKAKKCLITNLK